MTRPAPAHRRPAVNPIWRYEILRCGHGALSAPPVAGMAVGGGVFALGRDGTVAAFGAVNTVPLVAGLVAATALGVDGVLELRLSAVVSHRRTIYRRMAAVLASAGAGALSVVLLAGGTAGSPVTLFLGNMIFTIALITVAAYAVTRYGATAGASTLIVTCWFAKVLVLDQYVGSMAAQAALFLVAAGALARLTALRISDTEALLREVGR